MNSSVTNPLNLTCASAAPGVPGDGPACIFPLHNNTRQVIDECYSMSGSSKTPPNVREITSDVLWGCNYLVVNIDEQTSVRALHRCVADKSGPPPSEIGAKISGCNDKLTAEDKKRSGAGKSVTVKSSLAMAVVVGVALAMSLKI